ncbi:MAG TPA: hypothetical protein VJO33_19600, partial [Gemmatimonadaceae bacterium]|nr:hypothetical protein [Gemmatimonadaceae bacterium]
MGVLSTMDGRNQVTVFFASGSGLTKFSAIVVQRVLNERKSGGKQRFRQSLREMLVDFFATPKRMPVADVQLPQGWSSAAGAGGPHEVLFSESRRLVRVGGRDFPLPPDERVLVLLAEEPAERSGAWTVDSHTMQIASCPYLGVDHALDKKANLLRMSEDARERDHAWRTAIAADP